MFERFLGLRPVRGLGALLLSLLLVVSACDRKPADQETTEKAPAAQVETPAAVSSSDDDLDPGVLTPGPAIWKVSGGKSEMWLLGTFHLLPMELEWRNDTINSAFSSADTIVFEADSSDMAAIQKYIQENALNPEGKTLRDFFTEEELQKVEAALSKVGLTVDGVAPYRPWFVTIQASVGLIVRLGFNPEAGVERVLEREGKAAGKQFAYLETAEEGLRALADHPDDIQAAMLLAFAKDADRSKEMLDDMLELWTTGDIDSLVELMNSSMVDTPELIEALLYQRNRNWMPKLLEMAEKDDHSYFVAVGAAHLAGEESVVDFLREKGYQVTRQ